MNKSYILNELNKIHKIDCNGKIIDEIIQLHIKKTNPNISDLLIHIQSVFNVSLLDLLRNINEVSNYKGVKGYEKVINTLIDIERKYHFFIENEISKDNQPFGIKSIGYNLKDRSSYSNINLERYDEETFVATIDSQVLLNLISTSVDQMSLVLDKGIYDLNLELLNKYFDSSEKLNKKLKSLISAKTPVGGYERVPSNRHELASLDETL